MVLWWAILVLVIVLLVRWIFGVPRRRPTNGEDGALRILRERYAKGEINKEQFDRMKADLGG
jgi:putative membrane protein